MTTLHIGTYVLGIGMVLYGIVGLATGWSDQASAFTLIMSGLAALGITHQNVQLAGRLNNY